MQHLIAVLPFQKLNSIDAVVRLTQKKPILDSEQLLLDEKNIEYILVYIFPVLKKYSYRKKEEILRL